MTRETTIFWPEAVLGCPLRRGYAQQADQRFVVTEVIDGPPRVRLSTDQARKMINADFLWTWEQLQVFEGFVASDLNMGLAWFRMNHLTGAGMVEHYCHLIGDYSIRAAPDSTKLFAVGFQVEAYLNANPVPPPFAFDDPFDARSVADPVPTDVVDARQADQPRPPDRIDALVPGA